MMDRQTVDYCVNGTSALKLQRLHEAGEKATIIAFPRHDNRKMHVEEAPNSIATSIRSRISNLLASSEMYCSLKFEDFRGCGYGIFTQRGIAALSTGAAALAIISLITGA